MDTTFDVVIIGGSFAGLATAMQLRRHRVLVIDKHPIGAQQMSACGTPLPIARALGAEQAIQEVHEALVLHTAGQEIRFPLRDPYVTFDYWRFCQAMLAQTGAEVRQAWGEIQADGTVVVGRETIQSRFVVDAAGWQAWQGAQTDGTAPVARFLGYGLETELPVRLDGRSGLHFYFTRDLVPSGYAWAFPCGPQTRFGVGSFDRKLKLRPALEQFLDGFGLQAGRTHGGVLATVRRSPTVGRLFRVGDSAGHCLPVTGEGIRTAIFHGIHCGRAIASALEGKLTADEAAELYRQQVQSMDRFHMRLLLLQSMFVLAPEWLLAWTARICARPVLTHRIMNRYLVASGWFVSEPAMA